MKNTLFITYDGLSDPLGQSQILPYLTGLSGLGYSITIVSCEKKRPFLKNKERIGKLLSENKITWDPVFYDNTFGILSAIMNISALRRKSFRLHKKKNFALVHCRSYPASLIGLEMKKKHGVKFIFDMRGFWADERVEGGLWNLKNPAYKIIYNFFKRKEKKFLSEADFTISLTEKAKDIIQGWKNISGQPIPVQVIPCCADLNHFSIEKIKPVNVLALKRRLSIEDKDFVLSYLGSLGTWYCLEEMLCFFKKLLLSKPNAKFLFITHDLPETIFSCSDKINIPREKLIVKSASYSEIPLFITLSDLSVFFIKPCFSKTASSPTKMGEVMAMGIPMVCNSNVGDVEEIIRKTNTGFIVNSFSDNEYDNAINEFNNYSKNNEEISKIAKELFSTEEGVRRYEKVYRLLT